MKGVRSDCSLIVKRLGIGMVRMRPSVRNGLVQIRIEDWRILGLG